MKKIIRKVLMETIEDKRLQMAYVYLSNYMSTLEEVVDKYYGDIYLHESGYGYAKVQIINRSDQCWVSWSFWKKFSDEFSLQESEVQLLITYWLEKAYQLKGVNTSLVSFLLTLPK